MVSLDAVHDAKAISNAMMYNFFMVIFFKDNGNEMINEIDLHNTN